MNVKLKAGNALLFLLRNEYEKQIKIYVEAKKAEDPELEEVEVATFEEWLKKIDVAEELCKILGPDGGKMTKM